MAITKLFGKKKKRMGFQETPPKQRTRDEINQEYNQHAAMHGHKSALLAETREHFEKAIHTAEIELESHVVKMLYLRKEAAELPPEEPKTPEDPEAA